MPDSDGGNSIRGQVQVKPAGPCSEHVVASALSTLHISEIFYTSPLGIYFHGSSQSHFLFASVSKSFQLFPSRVHCELISMLVALPDTTLAFIQAWGLTQGGHSRSAPVMLYH